MNTDLRSYAHNYTSLRYSQGSDVLWYNTHFCNFLNVYSYTSLQTVYIHPGNQTIEFLLFIWYQNLDYFWERKKHTVLAEIQTHTTDFATPQC